MSRDIERSELMNELDEIVHDLREDIAGGRLPIDEAMGAGMRRGVIALFQAHRSDPQRLVQELRDFGWVMFLAGREHALRGYSHTIGRSGGPSVQVPDTVADMFKE